MLKHLTFVVFSLKSSRVNIGSLTAFVTQFIAACIFCGMLQHVCCHVACSKKVCLRALANAVPLQHNCCSVLAFVLALARVLDWTWCNICNAYST